MKSESVRGSSREMHKETGAEIRWRRRAVCRNPVRERDQVGSLLLSL